MKLSQQIRIFFTFYLVVAAVLGAVIYFNAFSQPQLAIEDALIAGVLPSGFGVMTFSSQIEFILALIISLIPTLYFLIIKNKRAMSLILASSCLIFIITILLLTSQRILLPILYFEIALLIGTFVGIIIKMIFASSEAEFLRHAFSQFVSEKMLAELLWNPEKLKLQGKEVLLTVMFIDIRGFTTFSEKNPPVTVVNRLNNLLDKVTNSILNHNGTVDKYMGDAIMALWGAPMADKNQATNACEAALEIRKIITQETEFKVGIGINYGHAVVGNMGSSRRFDYTAIGDTVNTASRLEKATKELGETIVVTRAVASKLLEEKSKIELKDLGQILVKGKSHSLHVFGLVD